MKFFEETNAVKNLKRLAMKKWLIIIGSVVTLIPFAIVCGLGAFFTEFMEAATDTIAFIFQKLKEQREE